MSTEIRETGREPMKSSRTVELIKRTVPAIVAVTLGLLFGLGATATATMPGGDGLLVFSSQRDGNAEIYSSTLSGNTQVRLTDNPAADIDPVVSPDGSRIAFVSDRDGGDREIYVMDADGSNQTRLTEHAGDDMDPAFSPDGSRLAIRRNVDGNNEIFLIDASDGGNAVNLTQSIAAHSDFQPDFSPDGSKIVYQRFWSGSGDGFGNEVMLMNADGSDPVNLTENDNSVNDGRPSFSPDGTRIAFDSNRNDSRFEIYTMDLEGGSVERVTEVEDGIAQEPSFSPSGTRIAFRANAAPSGQVSLVPAAGGSVTALTGTDGNDKPSWQIDDTAPVTTISAGPEEAGTSGPETSFTFSSDEPEATFECRLDSDAWQPCTSPWVLDSLTPGEHSVEIRATDLGGNVEATPATRNWSVDATAPVVTIDDGPATLTSDVNATIAFTVDQPGSETECRLDPVEEETDWAACESPFELTELSDGPHRFEVRATSEYSVTGAPAIHEWTVDTLAPEVEITAHPDAVTGSDEATFEFTIDDPGAGSECRLDSEADENWESCDSPVTLTGLAGGNHRFEIRATDEAGNVGTVAGFEWHVDRTAPVVTIESGPDAVTGSAEAAVTFAIDDEEATAECRFDSADDADWTACESPFEAAALADGPHRLEVRATDIFGNVGESVSHEWTVDTDAPEVTIETAPPAESNSIHAGFTFSADETETTAECRLDPAGEESPWTECVSPVSFSDLADGEHRFEVRVIDPAGNVSPAAVYEWQVSTIKPVASILSGPSDPTAATSASFGLASDNIDATFECRLDPEEDAGWNACASPVEYSDLTHGDHVFEVRAVETDQGTGPVARYEWTVDLVAPTVELTGTPAPISGTTDPVFGFAADEPGTTAECRLDPADPEAPWAACVSPAAYSGLAEGSHRFEVRVTDAVGHVSEVASYEWIVETTPPVATIESGPESITTQIAAGFSFSADNPNAYFECQLDGASWETCTSGISYDQLADGSHEFEVRAVGYGAGPGPAASWTWQVDTITPTVAIISGPAGVTNATTAEFAFEASKPGFTFHCRLDAGPATPCTSPHNLTGLGVGQHDLLVELLDASDEVVDSAEWSWSVLAELPVVSITAAPATATSTGTAAFEFESDLAEAGFECRIDGGGWSVCNSPAAFTGLADGDHTFGLRASLPDSSPGAVVEHSWRVDTVAPDIRIAEGPGFLSRSGSASFGIVTDDPTADLACRLDDGAWVACADPLEFTGLADGEHVLRVRAADEVGNTSFDRYDWSIDSTAPAVSLTSTPPAGTTSRDAAFGFNADDPQAVFECRVDGGEWKTCSSVHELSVKVGPHEFAVRATDRIGNVSEPVTHAWEVNEPASKGLVPTLRVQRKVKLNRRGTARIALTQCPEGSCRVTVRKKVRMRVGKKRFRAAILASRSFYREPRTEVRLVALGRASRFLRKSRRPAVLKLRITVISDNGKRRSRTQVIRIFGR